jgi:hypothetical protein
MKGLIVVVCLVLAGCAAAPRAASVAAAPQPAPPPVPRMVWDRIDGQHPPGWQQQAETDLAACKANARLHETAHQ